MDSGDTKSLIVKGRVLFYEKKYSEALDFLLRALKLLENDAVINEYLGDTYYFLGDISKANDFWLNAKLLGSKNKYLEQKIKTKTYHEALY